MKVMIFGFDGLRPDCITKDTMPNLFAFLEQNVRCEDNRSVYPTETYVNHPSIFSGFLPERHGLVANAYFDPAVSRARFFLGSSVELIEEAESATKGGLFKVPTLTEVLSEKGLSYISLSSNSPGSTRLIAHKSQTLGGVNISVNGLKYALPEYMRGIFGEDPANGMLEKPDLKGLIKINEIFNTLTEEHGLPDLSILWYGEPDHSFHAHGIGSREAISSLVQADACFGEMYGRYANEDDVHVIVASDHGHITISERFNLTEALVKAGFRHGNDLDSADADFSLLWGYSGNIYLHERRLLPDMVEVLQSMPQIGMLFTQDHDGIGGIVPGTFSTRLVAGDGPRGGDIRFILRNDNNLNDHGFSGTCICDGPLEAGCSIHGGLHPSEINCLLGFGGPSFKKSLVVKNATGVIDITPTIYKLFGIEPRVLPQGRILGEIFKDAVDNAGVNPVRRAFTASRGSFSQSLIIDYVSGMPYIAQGLRD